MSERAKAKKREETRIQNGIRTTIGAEPDFELFRCNNGVATYGKARVVYGLGTGAPDLVGMLTVFGVAVWVAFEVKVPGEDATDEQRAVHATWRRFGALVFVVHSVEEAVAMLEYARGTARAIIREAVVGGAS
jgi:hypothetical protein